MKYTVQAEEQDHMYYVELQVEASSPEAARDKALKEWNKKYGWGVMYLTVREGWLGPNLLED